MLCTTPRALELQHGVGAGLAYSDNVDLVDDDEEDDFVAIGYVGATLSEDSGPLRAEAVSFFTYQKYLDDTIGDQTYFNLGANAEWEQVRQRLYWGASNYFTQEKIDSLEAERTSNLQNTNVFTLGPSIKFQPSAAHVVSVNPQYRNFYYENSDTDNQEYVLTAGWFYQLRPTLQVGIDGEVTKVDYDDEDRNPNTVSSNVQAAFSGTGPHSSYALNFGITHVSRDRFENTSGFTGDATWLRELTGHSSVRLHLNSQLTNTSNALLDSQSNPDNGSFSGTQINGDVIRSNGVTLVYRRTGHVFDATVSGQAQDIDYKEAQTDREIYQFGADLNYKATRLVDGGLKMYYKHLQEDETNRTDKEYSIIGSISYHISRKLRTEFAVRYRDKSSDLDIDEYTEKAVFFGLIWGYGSIPRTGVL